MQITDIRVNHIERPMGFCVSPLSVSWKVVEAGDAKYQICARIQVRKGQEMVFDSGEDKTADSLDYRVEIPLLPRSRYDFTITVMADNGDSAAADSFFETGKMLESWQGKWIASSLDKNCPPVMEKVFQVKKTVRTARAYMCGLGVYECYINRKKVGQEFLAPGYHSYDLHLQAQTYDIAEYLTKGENRIQVYLGDGWFKGRLGFDGGYPNLYGDTSYLIQEIHLAYEDGTTEIIGSDETYLCNKSPILENSIYDGEVYDARLADLAREEGIPAILKQPRDCGILMDRYSLPVVKKEKIMPIELILTPKGETVLDFGQNLTGWVEFDCDLKNGGRITLTAAEILQDGCFYHENLRVAKTEFVYISNGRKSHVRPHFTFYGFRYMKIETTGEVRKEDFAAYHLRSDFDQIGAIETGNEKVNQLFSNALWSQKDNFLDVPTDCPQRDERLGWTGDAQVFSDTACFNMYMPAFYRKYLWDMRAEQSILDGSVPNVVPRIKKERIGEHGSCPWADAGVIIPWNVYLHYGSRTLLEETYPGMKAWVEYQRKKEEAEGGEHLIKGGFHFADWLALDNEVPGPFGATDPLFVASAYYYKCAKIVSDAALVLQNQKHLFPGEIEAYRKDAQEFGALSTAILEALREKYYDENKNCLIKTQTAEAVTIGFEIWPDEVEKHSNALKKLVEKNGNHLNTGFVGTPLLNPALSAGGAHETAVKLLLNESYPGWLYCVNLGATTIWERWNSVMPDGHMNPEGMNSLNHYSYGSIEAFMYREVCGIHSVMEAPGYRRLLVAPKPSRRLGFARAVLDTASGRVVSGFSYLESGKVVFDVEIPFDAQAQVVLPQGIYTINGNGTESSSFTLEAGSYRIEEK